MRGAVVSILGGIVLAACTPKSVNDEALADVRREVTVAQLAYAKSALTLTGGPILWADHQRVRYKTGDELRTESWEVADLPPSQKAALLGFMAAHKVEAISATKTRVNFALRSAGIAPSGVVIGVTVASGDEHDFGTINTPLQRGTGGKACERIASNVYLYVQQ